MRPLLPISQPFLTTQYKWIVGYTYYNASHILMTWGWLLLKQCYKVFPREMIVENGV